jgi:hypothetical protein
MILCLGQVLLFCDGRHTGMLIPFTETERLLRFEAATISSKSYYSKAFKGQK